MILLLQFSQRKGIKRKARKHKRTMFDARPVNNMQQGNSESICLTKKFKFDIGIRSHTVCRIVDSVRAKKTNESRVATPPGQRKEGQIASDKNEINTQNEHIDDGRVHAHRTLVELFVWIFDDVTRLGVSLDSKFFGKKLLQRFRCYLVINVQSQSNYA